MSSELKRRSDESKRSVFDRLGPDTKSASVNTTASSKITIKMSSVCPSYAKTGYCQLGSKCKYEHVRKGKDKDELRSKAAKKEKESTEKINDQPKESEAKIKSAIVSKSSDDSDKKSRKVVDTSTKTVKLNVRSPSPGLKKRKVDEQYQVKQKDKKSEMPKEESRTDQKYKNDEKCLDKSSSKHKRIDPLVATRTSSSSSKKTGNSILSPPSSSSKDGKSLEAGKHQREEPHLKSHTKTSADASKVALKSKMESSKREEKKERNSKDRKYGNNLTTTSGVSNADAEQKIQKHQVKLKDHPGSKVAVKTKKRQRSVSESTSSSSSSGSSSSSSGSSSGSSSRSSYTSNERLSLERLKRKEDGDKKAKSAKQIVADKQVVKKLDDGHKKAITGKHSREYSEDKLHDKVDQKVKKSRPKADSSRGKRDFSGSPSPRFNSPAAREREERYYPSRKQVDNERYVRMKIHDPEYEHDRGSLERLHECRRVKVDPYLDKISPGVEARRKESEYYRGEDYVRYRRDDEYESLDRRKSRERPPYDLPDKDAMYSDEPIRRERLSRRGHWEQMETEDMTRSKHKRHLSNESYSPARKKKRSTPHDEYRDRNDKIYESEGRKKDYERDEDTLMDDMTYKSRHRRSSHDSWHRHSKERRMRRDKSDHERSRERVRDDYYGRSPVESSDYSPRHRPEHSKRSGEYSSFDYDVDRGRRSLSRSSMGSKPPGRSRYYEGKRSLGGTGATVTAPHYQSSYEYRDSYHATPETEILEGRSFQAKPIYWDDYKRVDGPPSASFRGVPTHTRPSHIPVSTTVPPVDWEAGRMPGKQPALEWDARYERSSEEFLSRKDNLLPPPPRARHEKSEVASPAAPVGNSQTTSAEVPNADSQLLKAMNFELEGYEEIVDDDLDECLTQEDEEDEAAGEKDGGRSTYDEEMENLPRKIPLADMSDIEWESLVKSDDLKIKATCAPVEHKFTDVIREVGVSRQYAGDELFERINSVLIEEIDEEQEEEEDVKVALNGASDDDDDGNNNAAQISEADINGSTIELKTEPKENGEEISSSATLLSEETQYDSDVTEGRGQRDQEIVDGLLEGKENKIVEVKLENCEPHYDTKSSSAPKKKGPLLHDVANFHVTAFFKKKRQLSALRDIGPYRRALCARRDLAIRRTLCRIEKDEILMFPAQLADQELYKLSLQLFHQNDKETQENSAPLTLA